MTNIYAIRLSSLIKCVGVIYVISKFTQIYLFELDVFKTFVEKHHLRLILFKYFETLTYLKMTTGGLFQLLNTLKHEVQKSSCIYS